MPYPIGVLLEQSLYRYRDIYIQIYLGLDPDLSGSRDVIGHVTIRFRRCHFL